MVCFANDKRVFAVCFQAQAANEECGMCPKSILASSNKLLLLLMIEYYSVGNRNSLNAVSCFPSGECGVSTDAALGISYQYYTSPNLAHESGARYACVRSIPNREPIYWRSYFWGWRIDERWRTRGRRVECRPPTTLSDRELPPVGHGEVDYAHGPALFQW